MPSKKEKPKPLFSVKHDFMDSLEAFIQASMMLENAISTALSLTKPGEPLPEAVRTLLQERANAWRAATLSNDQG